MNHLLLGAANEMPPPRISWKRLERLTGEKRVRQQQAPQAIVGIILSHVRRRRQQEQVLRRPGKFPARPVRLGTSQGFRQPVAVRLAYPEIRLAVGGELVGFVEDDEVIGLGLRLPETAERAFPGQGVEADDGQVARRSEKGVVGACVDAADDAERQAEQAAHFPLPVADQTGRRHDEHAAHQPPRQHFTHVQARHDRLARSRVVGQQKAQRRLFQHVLVHGDALMRERVDQGRFRRERRIEEMAVGETMRFGDRQDDVWAGGKGHAERRVGLIVRVDLLWARPFLRLRLVFKDAPPGQIVWA